MVTIYICVLFLVFILATAFLGDGWALFLSLLLLLFPWIATKLDDRCLNCRCRKYTMVEDDDPSDRTRSWIRKKCVKCGSTWDDKCIEDEGGRR